MPYHLFICRHAQAQNPDFNQPDLDRQLTNQGIVEAEQAGNWLQQLSFKPDLIISSNARRASSTASILASKISYNQKDIVMDSSLYNASESQLLACLTKTDKANNAVLLVGHNPGVSDLVSTLSGTFRGNVPTGSVHHLSFELQNWEKLFLATANNYESNIRATY